MGQLDIDAQALNEYVDSRTDILQLIGQLETAGFNLNNQRVDTSMMRFASSEAIFNHGLIRIAFLSGWKNLVSSDKWQPFVGIVRTYIEEEIARKGEFCMSVPIHYLHFLKK